MAGLRLYSREQKIVISEKLKIDRTFMWTHTAPTCGEIFLWENDSTR